MGYSGETQKMTQEKKESQKVLQMLQQKIGNLELTVHSLMNVLEKELDTTDTSIQERINEEAEQIVEEMKNISNSEEAQKEVRERVKNDENNNS